jgi:hypothetical protein
LTNPEEPLCGADFAFTVSPASVARWMKRIILFFGIFGCLATSTEARDLGQWDAQSGNPGMVSGLMQPDVPNAPCCGEADAYWADEIHVRDGKTYATITDDRPDEPRGRPHVVIERRLKSPTTNSNGTNRIQRPRHRFSEPQRLRPHHG